MLPPTPAIFDVKNPMEVRKDAKRFGAWLLAHLTSYRLGPAHHLLRRVPGKDARDSAGTVRLHPVCCVHCESPSSKAIRPIWAAGRGEIGTLKGNKAHGRIGCATTGNGGCALQTRRRSNASKTMIAALDARYLAAPAARRATCALMWAPRPFRVYERSG